LGIDQLPGGVEGVIDRSKPCAVGIRNRSFGRAATLFADARYGFHPETGELCAQLLDIKGVGTHRDAAVSENPRNSGLLSLADALREFALQRLIQRLSLCQPDEQQPSAWNTVKFYAILDTGLKYADGFVNPATGLKNERCVLAVRQAQSRAFVNYNGYAFFMARKCF
jgi:hypothetical protein